MLRAQQLVQRDQRGIVLPVRIAQDLAVVVQGKVHHGQLVVQGIEEGRGHLLVEEVGLPARESSGLEVLEAFHQRLVLRHGLLPGGRIEEVPLVQVGDHQVLQRDVLRPDAFAQVVEQQLVQRLAPQVVRLGHLGSVARSLGLDDHAHGALGVLAGVYHQVVAALGVDVVGWRKAALLQELADEVLVVLLALTRLGMVQHADERCLEPLDGLAFGLLFEEGLVEGFAGSYGQMAHGWVVGAGKPLCSLRG